MLREGERTRAPNLRNLLEATFAIVSAVQPGDLFDRIVETACMLVDARCGALAITGPQGEKELVEFHTDRIRRTSDKCAIDCHSRIPQNTTGFLAVPIQSRGGLMATIYLTEPREGGDFSADDEELMRAFATVAGAVIESAQLSEDGRQRELCVALHGEITTALLTGVPYVKVLDLITRGARELTDADVVTLCLNESESLVISASAGRGAELLIGAQVALEGTASGEVVRTGQPVIVTDATSDHRRAEPIIALGGIATAMVVPIVLQGHTTGALAVGRSGTCGALTQTDFWMLESFASQMSIAMEYGMARKELERLALLNDQERIARDLHDTVIQHLFATGMSLQATAQRINDAATRDRVQQAIESLDNTISAIRQTVFALRPSSHRHGSLRDTLAALVEHIQEPHEFKTHMSFDGPVDTTIDPEKEAHLVATVREALSNVARHARARQVAISLTVGSDIVLRVTDDGVGIGREVIRRSGLLNLEARAQDLGGSMCVSTPAAGGTLLEWSVPLEETMAAEA